MVYARCRIWQLNVPLCSEGPHRIAHSMQNCETRASQRSGSSSCRRFFFFSFLFSAKIESALFMLASTASGLSFVCVGIWSGICTRWLSPYMYECYGTIATQCDPSSLNHEKFTIRMDNNATSNVRNPKPIWIAQNKSSEKREAVEQLKMKLWRMYFRYLYRDARAREKHLHFYVSVR